MFAIKSLLNLTRKRPDSSYYSPNENYFERLGSIFKEAETYQALLGFAAELKVKKAKIEIKNSISADLNGIKAKFGATQKLFPSILPNGKILFYKTMIGGYRVKCDFHLCGNKLLMYRYSFNFLNENDKENLKTILFSKYSDDVFNPENVKLIDSNGAMLFLKDDIDFTLYYIIDTKELMAKVESILEISKNDKASTIFQRRMELLDRL